MFSYLFIYLLILFGCFLLINEYKVHFVWVIRGEGIHSMAIPVPKCPTSYVGCGGSLSILLISASIVLSENHPHIA